MKASIATPQKTVTDKYSNLNEFVSVKLKDATESLKNVDLSVLKTNKKA
ncbi:MAG: hypothetical protein MUE30_00530 [Spirosomaceae bacterium]|jgi:hypothetical protein|nr:hypothetical protein [Spirosomataceae bacterium]